MPKVTLSLAGAGTKKHFICALDMLDNGKSGDQEIPVEIGTLPGKSGCIIKSVKYLILFILHNNMSSRNLDSHTAPSGLSTYQFLQHKNGSS